MKPETLLVKISPKNNNFKHIVLTNILCMTSMSDTDLGRKFCDKYISLALNMVTYRLGNRATKYSWFPSFPTV